METARLAFYNFGLHVAPSDSRAVEGFVLREPPNFEAAARACGFIGRSGYPGYPGPRSWGPQVFPRYIEGSGFTSAPSSLSLWADIESLLAFTYNGVHAGVAATAFRALAEKGINIKAITTSEIKISILIDGPYAELAVRTLHSCYGLDKN